MNQIKSAIGNTGAFNPENPNILYQKRKTNEYQDDILGNPLPDSGGADNNALPAGSTGKRHVLPTVKLRDEPANQGRYATKTVIQSETVKTLSVSKIETPKDAAAVMGLGHSAVERFYAIVNDVNHKPLAVVGSFKGTINAAKVYPAVVTAEEFRIKDAVNIWFVHNHTGGADFLKPTGLPNMAILLR